MEKIVQIDSVSVTYIKKNPPQIKIEARGKTATPNWTQPTLAGIIYVQAPPDGMWGYDFEATPPTKLGPDVLTDIRAELVLTEIPKGMKGVRVYGETNSKEAKLEGPK